MNSDFYSFDIGSKTEIKGIQPDNIVTTTRYSILSFIPLTIIENFQRFANIYFLFMALLSLMPWSPIPAIVQVFPLCFVISISMLKAAVEDILRYINDRKYNGVLFDVFRSLKFRRIPCSSIRPGDIIKISSGIEIPADVVILATSETGSACYVNEVNLNGETAIKQRKAVFASSQLSIEEATQINGKVTLSYPSKDITRLNGSIDANNNSFPFAIQNCLLRGVFLRHTKWVVGLVLYTGHDTRIIQNQRHPPHKTSRLERRLNQLIFFDFILNFFLVLILTYFSIVSEDSLSFYYVKKQSSKLSIFVEGFASYSILLSYMIPIALYVAIEFVRFFQRWTFSSDLGMFENGMGFCQPNNSNLNEELGQVDHVFSDKTGTLTENRMRFVQMTTRGRVFDVDLGANQVASLVNDDIEIIRHLECLSLCHSVIITSEGYSSESPDEEAIINQTPKIGAKLLSNVSDEYITIDLGGNERIYRHMAHIPFSSSRKRMSVILQSPDDEILVFTKGADSMVLGMISDQDDQRIKKEVEEQVNSFAESGLRTIVCAWKSIKQEEYHSWKMKLDLAHLDLENKEEKISEIGAEIETNMILIGAIAIEDQLQPMVPETVAYLTRMDVKFWVLTGDKKETAISIAKSTNVILPDSKVVEIMEGNKQECDSAYEIVQSNSKCVLIISPSALESIFQEDPLALVRIGDKCRSVVCFRMSPYLKSKVVETMRDNTDRVCLAIGDGANDVNMIQTANVGVGIFGREGHQAASNSDFAITRFKHLRRLMTCHGRLSLIRISGVILIMICKNVLLIFPQIWYSAFTNFSPTTIYDSMLISTYNLVWTIFPPIEYGWFEQDLSFKSMMTYPYIYKEARAGRYLSLWRFALEFTSVTYQSIILFLFNIYFPGGVILNSSGRTDGIGTAGFTLFVSVVMIANIQLALRSHSWNVYLFLSIYLSIFVFFLFTLPYGSLSYLIPSMYSIPQTVFTEYSSYAIIFLSVLASLAPEAIFRFIKAMKYPSFSRIIREMEQLNC